MRKLILIILFGLSVLTAPAAVDSTLVRDHSDSIRISLVTCSPGTAVYEVYGHTALRVEIPSLGVDAAVNTAKEDLEAARRQLMDALSDYAGFRKHRVVLVFDGYKVKGNPGEKETFHNIQVVYTRENETGDSYIESLVAQIGGNYNLRVASSDALVQLSSIRSGVLRVSARELKEEVELARKEMGKQRAAS